MNICRNDIYFLIIFIILIYLLYKDFYKNEKFDSVSDTKALINQVYNADIEAIRNLSSIASKLIKEGGLVVPGKLQVTDTLTAKALYSSGGTGAGTGTHFPWTDGINYIGGNTKISNDLSVGGKLNLPNNTSLSADGDDATHWLRLQQTNNPGQYKSLAVKDLWCQAGDSVLHSTTINNSGNVTTGALKANGNITIGNTTINESHLQMLTGQADFLIEHTRRRKGNNNTDPNQGPSRYLHSGDNGVISRYKDENASFFKLVKE